MSGIADQYPTVQIEGRTGLIADVSLIEGKHKIETQATVIVEEVFGRDDLADVWFWIGISDDNCDGVGSAGDTIRVQIPAGCNATLNPAADVTYTLVAGDLAAAHPALQVRDNVVAALNGNVNFAKSWKASKIKDVAAVHISAKFRGEAGVRTSWTLSTTGTTTTTAAYADIVRRGKATSLARDPDNPRIGILGISGSVTATPGAVGDLYIENAKNAGSENLRVNGSVTPVIFSIPISATKDTFITEIRIYGNANGIKFGDFLSITALTNGLKVDIKSDDAMITLPLIKTTDDLKHKFALGEGLFQLHVQSGRDDVMGTYIFPAPIPLRKQGTFTTEDYVKITVQDNLSSGLQLLEFLAAGFEKEA